MVFALLIIFPLLCLLLLYFLSLNKSYSLNNESDELGSDSGSSGTYYFCAFSLIFDEFVVSVLGSDVFSPIGFVSKDGIFLSKTFVPKRVKSKGGQILALFWLSNYLFSFQISKSVL